MSNIGTIVRGIKLPIIKSGDNIKEIIKDTLTETSLKDNIKFKDNDIIAITESLIARAYNNYVTVDDIADFIREKYGRNATVCVLWPIYSRNRFSLILKGIARGCKHVVVQLYSNKDRVGNNIINPWTQIDITDYYREIIEQENSECTILQSDYILDGAKIANLNVIISDPHLLTNDDDYKSFYNRLTRYNVVRLSDIFYIKTNKHGWSEYGLLGSNKCGDEILKLFPTKESCKEVCEYIKDWIKETTNKDIHVMVYGDGCFKDPDSGIWEFADPISCPYHTGELLDKSPNEIKLKYVIDDITNNPEKIKSLIENKDNKISDDPMLAQGTTPRKYYNLIASLCDLTSGSGDKGTPVIWIQNYFNNYSNI